MKLLMIGAHQDDNEFRCGGLASACAKRGHEVRFLSLTNGSGGHHIMTPEETAKQRAAESAAVAKVLGIRYDVWDIEDCTVTADLNTRRRLTRYIREFQPDVIITHRSNDYHTDHRATGLLVQDASYLLIVPHECPDVPAMRKTPLIMYYEDKFINPPFCPDLVVGIDEEIEVKLQAAHLNTSQVYEWLPYTRGESVPENETERYAWLVGNKIDADTTDDEVMSMKRGYAARFAKPAARFRTRLIEEYGENRGRKIRFAEAFQISEYGGVLTEEIKQALLNK